LSATVPLKAPLPPEAPLLVHTSARNHLTVAGAAAVLLAVCEGQPPGRAHWSLSSSSPCCPLCLFAMVCAQVIDAALRRD